MANIQIIQGDFEKKLKLQFAPVSIGLAPNKTLAKMASHFAKKYQGYRHCCMIDTDEKRIKALKLYPIDEVWGIGRRYAARLEALGVKTAYDFAEHNWNFQEMRLVTPSSSTITIVKAANEVLQKLYRQGYHYKKAGVIVMGIGPNSPIQQDLFDINAEQFEKMKRLDAVIDRINKVNGTETIVLGSQQYTQKDGKGKAQVFANAIKHDFKSKNPTTRWSDITVLK